MSADKYSRKTKKNPCCLKVKDFLVVFKRILIIFFQNFTWVVAKRLCSLIISAMEEALVPSLVYCH
jgi:hypothetical protein